MNFALIDFEATGVDTKVDRATEIGCMLVEQVHNDDLGTQALAGMSAYIYDNYPPLSEEVKALNGIDDEILKSEGRRFPDVIRTLSATFLPYGVDFFVAHNKGYDEALFRAEWARYVDELRDLEYLLGVPWLCTIEDIDHKIRSKCRKLSHLALEYGVAVDPSKLHRAFDDVRLLAELIDFAQIDLGYVAARSAIPNVFIKAIVPSPFGRSGDGGVGKDRAKSCGFRWQKWSDDSPEFFQSWIKRVKQDRVDAEKESLGYEIEIQSV